MTEETLSAYFHLPLKTAAKEIGVSETYLKNTCRKLGYQRWPFGKKLTMPREELTNVAHDTQNATPVLPVSAVVPEVLLSPQENESNLGQVDVTALDLFVIPEGATPELHSSKAASTEEIKQEEIHFSQNPPEMAAGVGWAFLTLNECIQLHEVSSPRTLEALDAEVMAS